MKKESRESLATLIYLKLSNLNILKRSSFTKSVDFDFKKANKSAKKFTERDRIRTCNLLLRRQTRYPLRH